MKTPMTTMHRIAAVMLKTCRAGALGALTLGAVAQAAPAPPATLQPGASCVTSECHAGVKQGKFTHGPMNMGQCEPCHVAVGNKHEFKKIGDTKGLCLTCHQTEEKMKFVHKPFAADCTLCHSPHSSDNRYFVKGGAGAASCKQCHSDVTKGLTHLHGPVGQGECLACHSPHQSNNPNLLSDPQDKLCFSCHTDFQEKMAGAVSVHAPAQKNCTGCHGAHGGKTEYFLSGQGRQMCEKCHGDFLKGMDKLKHPHQPMVDGKGCEACHEAHASKQEKLLKSKNEDLCLSCHNQKIQGKTRTIANIAEQLDHAKYLHGPLRQKNCIACHAAHGSDNANILEKAFPSSFYAPYQDKAYDLCFNCHDKQIVLNERSTATGFRNGDVNLHYLHVNREKGRSCRACHDEHASNQPNHIRESVPFGRWTMHTTFTKNENGGGCMTGCHVPYKYDRKNPVSNKTPGGKDSK